MTERYDERGLIVPGSLGTRITGGGEGWRLRPTAAYGWPVDYEGPAGSGLSIPFKKASSVAKWMCWGFAIYVGLGALVTVVVTVIDHDPDGFSSTLLAIVVVVALYLWGRWLARRSGEQLLLLTEEGVRIGYDTATVHIPWGSLRAVRPHWTELAVRRGTAYGARPLNWLTFGVDPDSGLRMPGIRGYAGTTEPSVGIDRMLVAPGLVVAIVEFYRDHPEARGELGSTVWQDRVQALARDLPQG